MLIDADPDRLAELEEERAFLLRSLRDLDAERAAGDVDEQDYVTLRDGYTRRAADVLKRIEAGRAELPPTPAKPWRNRLAVAVVIALIAGSAGWFVARSSGPRFAGEEITGDLPGSGVAAKLATARQLLAADPARAIELYGEVLDERPGHAEALAYSGWLLFTSSGGASDDLREQAVETARIQLEDAVESDPEYPDPHCFLAVILANHDGDDAAALDEAEQCLALDPPQDLRGLMEPFVERLEAG